MAQHQAQQRRPFRSASVGPPDDDRLMGAGFPLVPDRWMRTSHKDVRAVYARLAPVYDWFFSTILQPGRVEAIESMRALRGPSVLEVGVGTGLNAELYPQDFVVTGIDASRSMLQRAERRLNLRGVRNVRLMEMDAGALAFQDDAFDLVFGSYVITAVADPVAVAREMRRVCRPGGHIVLLNHFLSARPTLARLERAVSRFTLSLGFQSAVPFDALAAKAGLTPVDTRKVNRPPLWSLVTCRKESSPASH